MTAGSFLLCTCIHFASYFIYNSTEKRNGKRLQEVSFRSQRGCTGGEHPFRDAGAASPIREAYARNNTLLYSKVAAYE